MLVHLFLIGTISVFINFKLITGIYFIFIYLPESLLGLCAGQQQLCCVLNM